MSNPKRRHAGLRRGGDTDELGDLVIKWLSEGRTANENGMKGFTLRIWDRQGAKVRSTTPSPAKGILGEWELPDRSRRRVEGGVKVTEPRLERSRSRNHKGGRHPRERRKKSYLTKRCSSSWAVARENTVDAYYRSRGLGRKGERNNCASIKCGRTRTQQYATRSKLVGPTVHGPPVRRRKEIICGTH